VGVKKVVTTIRDYILDAEWGTNPDYGQGTTRDDEKILTNGYGEAAPHGTTRKY